MGSPKPQFSHLYNGGLRSPQEECLEPWSPRASSFHICIMGVEKVEQPPRVWHSCGPLLVSGPVSLGAGWLVVVGQTRRGTVQ